MQEMKIYDAHIHLLFRYPSHQLEDTFEYLKSLGLGGCDVLVIAEFPQEIGTILKMVPKNYHKDVNLRILQNQAHPFHILNKISYMKIVPYLDTRYFECEIDRKIKEYRQLGFMGVKLLYVPEEDSLLGIAGMEEAFRRSRQQSETIVSQIIESASNQNMSVLIHVDLRREKEFISDVVNAYPRTHFNIAHFGFSRRAIAPLLEKYLNCYTDCSSLLPFIKKYPQSYEKFIRRYQDRVLFGSDALIGRPVKVKDSLDILDRYLKDKGLLRKIYRDNYLRFHGLFVKTNAKKH